MPSLAKSYLPLLVLAIVASPFANTGLDAARLGHQDLVLELDTDDLNVLSDDGLDLRSLELHQPVPDAQQFSISKPFLLCHQPGVPSETGDRDGAEPSGTTGGVDWEREVVGDRYMCATS